MKKYEINFLQTTTIEHLQDKIPCCYGGALAFGEKVLVTMVLLPIYPARKLIRLIVTE